MALKRKAIFLTIAALLLAVLSVLAFVGIVRVTAPQQRAIDIRITTLNNYLLDMERDLERAIFISGYRAILALDDVVIQRGKYLNDTETAFFMAAVNGTFVNGSITSRLDLLENATLINWSDRLQAESRDIGINITLQFGNVSIQHVSPWDVRVFLNASILLKDATGLASFNVTRTASSIISIIGFEDPIYPLNTLARITNVINQTTITDFIAGNSTTNLQLHANNSWYINHSDGPDFLMRLEGNETGSSPYGIESLVNLDELSGQGLSIQAKSVVDHIYFTNKSVTSCRVTGMPTWYYTDTNHTLVYETSAIDQSPC
jgi:hypothetical protein